MKENEDRDLVERCRQMWDAASEAAKLLRSHLGSAANSGQVYTFKNRLKSPTGIFSKVRRKRDEGEREGDPNRKLYGADDVTDIWGCRYVTLYQSHIPHAVKALLECLDDFNRQSPDKVELVEFVIYTNRPEKDPLSITRETMAVLRASNLCATIAEGSQAIRAPENRISAYSSVHLIFSLVVTIEHPSKGKVRETARFEVQVRDIFEEGWGEIQHDLIYSIKDRRDQAETDTSFDPLWQPHLNALKTFVDGCSQHASIIKRSYDILFPVSMPSLDTKSATSRQFDRSAIVGAVRSKVTAGVVQAIELAYEYLITAQSATAKEEARANYLLAATKFEEAIEGVGPHGETQIPEAGGLPVTYFLKLELANCFSFSDDVARLKPAVELYHSIAKRFPRDPTVRLRSARAEVRLRKEDRQALLDAIDLVEECIHLIADDVLTGPKHWLKMAAYIQLGFTHWLISDLAAKDRDFGSQEASLEAATTSTLQAFQFWVDLDEALKGEETYRLYAHKAISNVLYYVARSLGLRPGGQRYDAEAIRGFLTTLDSIPVPEYLEYYKTRDNKMHALIAVGSKAEARGLARQNVGELRRRAEARAGRPLAMTSVDTELDEGEAFCFRTASAILAEGEEGS
jgi:ppGpp synthetase/RelA/SpoT-type nucleotidyltranferase